MCNLTQKSKHPRNTLGDSQKTLDESTPTPVLSLYTQYETLKDSTRISPPHNRGQEVAIAELETR